MAWDRNPFFLSKAQDVRDTCRRRLRFFRLPEPDQTTNPAFFDDDAEQALLDRYSVAESAFAAEMARSEYPAALKTLAATRPAVDAFFEAVMVMGEDVDRRDNRLSLLGCLRELFQQFADFDRIVAGESGNSTLHD